MLVSIILKVEFAASPHMSPLRYLEDWTPAHSFNVTNAGTSKHAQTRVLATQQLLPLARSHAGGTK